MDFNKGIEHISTIFHVKKVKAVLISFYVHSHQLANSTNIKIKKKKKTRKNLDKTHLNKK